MTTRHTKKQRYDFAKAASVKGDAIVAATADVQPATVAGWRKEFGFPSGPPRSDGVPYESALTEAAASHRTAAIADITDVSDKLRDEVFRCNWNMMSTHPDRHITDDSIERLSQIAEAYAVPIDALRGTFHWFAQVCNLLRAAERLCGSDDDDVRSLSLFVRRELSGLPDSPDVESATAVIDEIVRTLKRIADAWKAKCAQIGVTEIKIGGTSPWTDYLMNFSSAQTDI